MARTGVRPHAERVTADDFVARAKYMGLSTPVARRVWCKVVSHVKGARHTWRAASDEYVTRGQLQGAVKIGRRKVRMTEQDWGGFTLTAEHFTQRLG